MNKPSAASSKGWDQTRSPVAGSDPVEGPGDAELVSRSRQGDLEAFDALVTRYRGRIYSMIHQMVRNEADAWDLSQDAFIKAWNALSRFEERSSFYTWLYRIAHNVTYDWLRKRRIHPEAEFDETLQPAVDPGADPVSPSAQSPDEDLAQRETGERIQAAIAELSPVHRETILLKEVEGCQYKEIAERMGCSIGTVMSRLFYAREKTTIPAWRSVCRILRQIGIAGSTTLPSPRGRPPRSFATALRIPPRRGRRQPCSGWLAISVPRCPNPWSRLIPAFSTNKSAGASNGQPCSKRTHPPPKVSRGCAGSHGRNWFPSPRAFCSRSPPFKPSCCLPRTRRRPKSYTPTAHSPACTSSPAIRRKRMQPSSGLRARKPFPKISICSRPIWELSRLSPPEVPPYFPAARPPRLFLRTRKRPLSAMQSLARVAAALTCAFALPAVSLSAGGESPQPPPPERETYIEGLVIYASRKEEDRRSGKRFSEVPRDLSERLRKAFRDLDLHSFQTVESQTQPIYKAYDSWVFPDSKFKLELNSQGRTSDGGLKVVIQLWQDDLVLLKSDTILRGDSPLFIAGNPWGRGRLLFVLRLHNPSADENVRDRAKGR